MCSKAGALGYMLAPGGSDLTDLIGCFNRKCKWLAADESGNFMSHISLVGKEKCACHLTVDLVSRDHPLKPFFCGLKCKTKSLKVEFERHKSKMLISSNSSFDNDILISNFYLDFRPAKMHHRGFIACWPAWAVQIIENLARCS